MATGRKGRKTGHVEAWSEGSQEGSHSFTQQTSTRQQLGTKFYFRVLSAPGTNFAPCMPDPLGFLLAGSIPRRAGELGFSSSPGLLTVRSVCRVSCPAGPRAAVRITHVPTVQVAPHPKVLQLVRLGLRGHVVGPWHSDNRNLLMTMRMNEP